MKRIGLLIALCFFLVSGNVQNLSIQDDIITFNTRDGESSQIFFNKAVIQYSIDSGTANITLANLGTEVLDF